jgi:phosphoribosyl 1,2-cyclic phosphodiesterase
MKIRIWGTRGSIPSPGREMSRYGGNTTCVEVRLTDNTLIIIDAGTGIRKLGQALIGETGLKDINLLLTHSHWDHLQGFPFFLPAYSGAYTIRVLGGPLARQSLKKYLAHQMEPPFFPVNFRLLEARFHFDGSDAVEAVGTRRIGGADVTSIPLNHPNGGYGFEIREQGGTFIFLTDNELGFSHPGGLSMEEYAERCRGADLVLHDAQYTDEEYERTRGWGHSTYSAAVSLAAAAGVRRFGLCHHDPDRSDDELDALVLKCRHQLRLAGSEVDCFAVREGMELEI